MLAYEYPDQLLEPAGKQCPTGSNVNGIACGLDSKGRCWNQTCLYPIEGVGFGGRRKGQRGRGAAGKSIVFGLLERNGRVYTKVVEQVTADELMTHIKAHTRKGSVYYTDTFRSYNSLKRLGKHHRLNHSKAFAYKGKNHINGIEGFWSYAKHILYNYRGVSKYHFPMYLKEVEYRYNHRHENLFKQFLEIYFGYVSV